MSLIVLGFTNTTNACYNSPENRIYIEWFLNDHQIDKQFGADVYEVKPLQLAKTQSFYTYSLSQQIRHSNTQFNVQFRLNNISFYNHNRIYHFNIRNFSLHKNSPEVLI